MFVKTKAFFFIVIIFLLPLNRVINKRNGKAKQAIAIITADSQKRG